MNIHSLKKALFYRNTICLKYEKGYNLNLKEKTNTDTRDIYLGQHNIYLKDDILFNRFVKMISDISYFHLPKNYFEGKKVLDAGCGNTAYFQYVMNKYYKVSQQTCLDLGKEWINPLKSKLNSLDVPLDNFSFVPGSTDKLPFDDETFDFVASNGVLVHLHDIEQAEIAMKELTRVLKKGGHLYVILGATGGLFEEEIIPALRRFYHKNNDFKDFIDTVSPKKIEQISKSISTSMQQNTNETFDYKQAAKLFDWDFCAFLQNIIQVPKRHCTEMDTEWITQQLNLLGFEKPKRCRRYVKRENIRKFFAPLHYNHEEQTSKMLYGEGNMEWIAKKYKEKN